MSLIELQRQTQALQANKSSKIIILTAGFGILVLLFLTLKRRPTVRKVIVPTVTERVIRQFREIVPPLTQIPPLPIPIRPPAQPPARTERLRGRPARIPLPSAYREIAGTIREVGRLGSRFRYVRFNNSTARAMRRDGHGDCWAMANFLCQELTRRGIRARRLQGAVQLSPRHRWTEFYHRGRWFPFPYTRYGIERIFGFTPNVWNVKIMKGCGE